MKLYNEQLLPSLSALGFSFLFKSTKNNVQLSYNGTKTQKSKFIKMWIAYSKVREFRIAIFIVVLGLYSLMGYLFPLSTAIFSIFLAVVLSKNIIHFQSKPKRRAKQLFLIFKNQKHDYQKAI